MKAGSVSKTTLETNGSYVTLKMQQQRDKTSNTKLQSTPTLSISGKSPAKMHTRPKCLWVSQSVFSSWLVSLAHKSFYNGLIGRKAALMMVQLKKSQLTGSTCLVWLTRCWSLYSANCTLSYQRGSYKMKITDTFPALRTPWSTKFTWSSSWTPTLVILLP